MSPNIYGAVYYINDLKSLIPFIDSLDIRTVGLNTESVVYLKTINRKIKKLLLNEQYFVRTGLNIKPYAIFRIPKKFEHIVNVINQVGIKGVTKRELLLYIQKKASDTEMYLGLFLFLLLQ